MLGRSQNDERHPKVAFVVEAPGVEGGRAVRRNINDDATLARTLLRLPRIPLGSWTVWFRRVPSRSTG